MYEIVPGLYVRGHIRRLRGKGAIEKFIKKNNIDVVVSTVKPYMHKVEKLVEDYIWFPIRDGELKPGHIRILELIAKDVTKSVKQGKKVVVHCNRGRNRSCFVATMIVAYLKGMTGKKAIKHVRKMRPNSLSNKFFVKHLEKYDGRHTR